MGSVAVASIRVRCVKITHTHTQTHNTIKQRQGIAEALLAYVANVAVFEKVVSLDSLEEHHGRWGSCYSLQ